MGAHPTYGYDLYCAGKLAMDSGDLARAIEMFTLSAAAEPHFKTFELLGECLLTSGRPKEAVLYLAAAAGLGKSEHRAFYLLGKAYSELGDREMAAEMLDRALSANPEYKAALELKNSLLEQRTRP